MEPYNRFLGRLSLPRMLWVSLSLTAKNLQVLLPLVLLFSLPVDLVSDWVTGYIAKTSDTRTVMLLCVQLILFSIFSDIGYIAIAWEVREIIEGETPSVSKALSALMGGALVRLFATMLYSGWRILWPLFVYVAVAVPFAMFFIPDPGVFLILYALGFLACLPFLVWNGLNYTLLIFPTLFEHQSFSAAARRSKLLVSGRRMWLFLVFMGQGVLGTAVCLAFTALLPHLMKWPEGDPHQVTGLFRSIYDSIASSLVMAVIVVLDTLIYFRLRREKNDLTFFDLSSTAVLPPAREFEEAT